MCVCYNQLDVVHKWLNLISRSELPLASEMHVVGHVVKKLRCSNMGNRSILDKLKTVFQNALNSAPQEPAQDDSKTDSEAKTEAAPGQIRAHKSTMSRWMALAIALYVLASSPPPTPVPFTEIKKKPHVVPAKKKTVLGVEEVDIADEAESPPPSLSPGGLKRKVQADPYVCLTPTKSTKYNGKHDAKQSPSKDEDEKEDENEDLVTPGSSARSGPSWPWGKNASEFVARSLEVFGPLEPNALGDWFLGSCLAQACAEVCHPVVLLLLPPAQEKCKRGPSSAWALYQRRATIFSVPDVADACLKIASYEGICRSSGQSNLVTMAGTLRSMFSVPACLPSVPLPHSHTHTLLCLFSSAQGVIRFQHADSLDLASVAASVAQSSSAPPLSHLTSAHVQTTPTSAETTPTSVKTASRPAETAPTPIPGQVIPKLAEFPAAPSLSSLSTPASPVTVLPELPPLPTLPEVAVLPPHQQVQPQPAAPLLPPSAISLDSSAASLAALAAPAAFSAASSSAASSGASSGASSAGSSSAGAAAPLAASMAAAASLPILASVPASLKRPRVDPAVPAPPLAEARPKPAVQSALEKAALQVVGSASDVLDTVLGFTEMNVKQDIEFMTQALGSTHRPSKRRKEKSSDDERPPSDPLDSKISVAPMGLAAALVTLVSSTREEAVLAATRAADCLATEHRVWSTSATSEGARLESERQMLLTQVKDMEEKLKATFEDTKTPLEDDPSASADKPDGSVDEPAVDAHDETVVVKSRLAARLQALAAETASEIRALEAKHAQRAAEMQADADAALAILLEAKVQARAHAKAQALAQALALSAAKAESKKAQKQVEHRLCIQELEASEKAIRLHEASVAWSKKLHQIELDTLSQLDSSKLTAVVDGLNSLHTHLEKSAPLLGEAKAARVEAEKHADAYRGVLETIAARLDRRELALKKLESQGRVANLKANIKIVLNRSNKLKAAPGSSDLKAAAAAAGPTPVVSDSFRSSITVASTAAAPPSS